MCNCMVCYQYSARYSPQCCRIALFSVDSCSGDVFFVENIQYISGPVLPKIGAIFLLLW